MWKPLTGEPYAGNPPVRFGGRGGESLSYPLSNEDQAFKLVILGLDPGIQSFFNINTKDKK